MSRLPWIVRVFGIWKKKINVVYGPEDEEGDNIPGHLEPFREMTLRSIGKTNWATTPPGKTIPKKAGALTTNEIQPGKPVDNKKQGA